MAFAMAHYDIEILGASQLTDKVFKIRTQDKVYALKFSEEDAFVMKQLYAYKEMPDHVLPIYQTRAGLNVAQTERGFAHLTNYVSKIPMPTEKRVADYSQLLRKLHTTTGLEIEKHDVEITSMYQTDYQRIERNFALLEQRMGEVELKASRSPFEWYLMMVYPLLYGMYRRSDDAMQKFYRQLARKKQLPVAMTHGDVNMANMLPCAKHSFLINFENSEFDVPTRDMALFLNHYHQLPGVRGMVTTYLKEQKNPLVVHDFFIRTLCLDLVAVFDEISGESLLDISILNERIAPGMVALQIYDELNAPKRPEKSDKKDAKGKND